jgi:very-short-patch-repair endonuclease
MMHTCDRCGVNFEYSGNVKRCQKCRVTCEKCGRPVSDRANLCGACRVVKRKMVSCAYPGCANAIRYDKHRAGYCIDHTDWTLHSKRMSEYNVSVKTKPQELKYKTERIPAIPATCVICGNVFLSTPSAINRGDTHVCSGRCRGVRAASLTPKKRTSIEVAIEKELQLRGIEYRDQYPLCGVTVVDFFLPSGNAVIYCDGNYWHSIPKRAESDKRQNEVLAQNGYRVFRFTETEINQSPSACVDRIYR